MTDIVERLRTRQVTNWMHATGQTPRASGKRTDPLCAAAADEIERLRAEAAGLREDAERWRWAVKRKNIVHWNDDYKPPFAVIRFHGDVTAQGHHKTLNEAVDAARKQKS